jgi:hypothetical protein
MVHLVDLRGGVRGLERKAGAGWPVLPLVDDFRNDWKIVEGQGDRLWFITDAGAPNGMVAELDIGPAEAPGSTRSGGRWLPQTRAVRAGAWWCPRVTGFWPGAMSWGIA